MYDQWRRRLVRKKIASEDRNDKEKSQAAVTKSCEDHAITEQEASQGGKQL
jgi:hypothetical protein